MKVAAMETMRVYEKIPNLDIMMAAVMERKKV